MDKRYSGDIERLRSPQRMQLLEVEQVTALALANLVPGKVLDVGIGSGIFAEAFAAHGWQVAGIDVREDMLEAARAYVPTADLKIGAAENLPFEDGEFDLLFYGHIMHEVSDLWQGLQEAYRVTKQRVVILEWPYEVGEFGPPRDHRLQPEMVIQQAQQVGFQQVENRRLQHMNVMILGR